MARWLQTLTLNQKLAILALALGGLAVFAKVAPARTTRVHEKELLTAAERKEDHVTPQELAAWIVEGRADYRLVDVRDAKAFAEYHIPTAENVPLATVADGSLGRTENVVLYGEGGIHAAQAWMVLKGRGYTSVRTLLEGLDGWKAEVLFPVQPVSPAPDEAARFERAVQLAKFFGGQPRAAAASGAEPAPLAVAAPALPSVAPPTLPGGGATAAPRKKKEGC
ncbi:MAG: rhodanese-like domain-containing protein [Vicinamibacteria bacterium]